MKNLNQKTLSERNEIFNALKELISNAKSEIHVVSAWFTDPELFEMLLLKQNSGVKVSIIVSDQKDNEKLPFYKISGAGGTVKKIKSSGYGVMHQKFCIIDGEVVVHGSYNWTVNARKNNHESVIVTNHTETVNEMKKLFNKLQGEVQDIRNGNSPGFIGKLKKLFTRKEEIKQDAVHEENVAQQSEEKLKIDIDEVDYTKVFDNILNSEVEVLDTEALKDLGKQRAKANGGDPSSIVNGLQIVYSGLLNDLTIGEDKLNSILTKIDVIQKRTELNIDAHRVLRKDSIKTIGNIELTDLNNKVEKIKVEVEKKLLSISGEEKKKISIKDAIDELKKQKQALKIENVTKKPSILKAITFSLSTIGLLFAALLFYSSATYIMLYGADEAQEIISTTGQAVELGIYDHEAFTKALGLGGTALLALFIVFFSLVTFTMAIVFKSKSSVKAGFIKSTLILTVVLIVDALMAYQVTYAIHDANVLSGFAEGDFNFFTQQVLLDFALVFTFGALTLIALKVSASKLSEYRSEIRGDKKQLEYSLKMAAFDDKIKAKYEEEEGIDNVIQDLKTEILDLEGETKSLENAIAQLNIDIEQRDLKAEELYLIQKEALGQNAERLKNKMESGRLPYSFDSVKERVAYFCEGWNEFLHEHFALAVATEKALEATVIKDQWLDEKDRGSQLHTIAA